MRFLGLLLAVLFSSSVWADSVCNSPTQLYSPSLQQADCKNNAAPDSYALSLSWSPQFCSSVNTNSAKYAHQCRNNKFKFVVHGLWPQKMSAKDKCDHPRNCDASLVAADTIKKMLCIIPSESLIQGEWQKHGTCSGMSAPAYFDKTAELWNSLKMPDIEALLDARGMTSSYDVVSAFVWTNPGLKRSAVSVSVKGGALEEVLVCYDTSFKFASCKPGQKSSKTKIRVARSN